MRVLDVAATRGIDRRATEEFGIPSLVLMENAALGVVEAVAEEFPEAERILLVCGPGNNGGDGLAAARHLTLRGFDTRVWLVGERELKGDAAVQEAICRRQGVVVERIARAASLPPDLAGWDLVIDALFGIGLSRPLAGLFAEVVGWLNELPVPVLAVDLPSGLAGDSADAQAPHVLADVTVTFETPKAAHVLPPAAHAVGELIVADLGIPGALAAEAPGDLLLATPELAREWLGQRAGDAHKGDFGHVLIAAGSLGMGGAAVLAARGAIRGGAGLVTCAVPEAVLPTVDAASLESMTLGLPATEEGAFALTAAEALLDAAATRDVLALGPGLGNGEETRELTREIARRTGGCLVLDASALLAFSGRPGLLNERKGPTILTPHAGEMAALLGVSVKSVVGDRLAAVRRASSETGAVVLLKGQASLITDGDQVVINSTGNPGMATGGTGDILTGLIAAFLAQGRSAMVAVSLGAFVHGAAGDLAVATTGETALAASDLLPELPRVIRELEVG